MAQACLMSTKQHLRTNYGALRSRKEGPRYHKVIFYRTASGWEPVREWLKQIDPANRKRIGEDLYTLQLGWPVIWLWQKSDWLFLEQRGDHEPG